MPLFTLLLLLRLRRGPTPLPAALTSAVRSMGGGPRTFPGGLNKWQYKRMHEKLAKEKERKLLHQEKQLYQARLRSEIRAKIAAGGDGQSPPSDPSSFTAMSSKEHIKALADRFMKEGAEDLWNEDDGPIYEKREGLKKEAVEVKKLGSFQQRREYSTRRMMRNLSSEDEDEEVDGGGLIRKESKFSKFGSTKERAEGLKKFVKDGKDSFGKLGSFRQRENSPRRMRNLSSDDNDEELEGLKISKFGIRKEEDEEEEEDRGFDGRTKKKMSWAALRNFDAKKERRKLKGENDGEESDLLEQIRGIRKDIKKRESFGRGAKATEESVITQKRYICQESC